MRDLERFDNDPKIDTWRKSGIVKGPDEPRVTWPENKRWLMERVLRGDDFGLATNEADLPKRDRGYKENEPNGYFTRLELDFLRRIGIEPKRMHEGN